MRKVVLMALAVFLAAATGCAQPAQKVDVESAREALRAADTEWARVAAAGDSDSFGSFLAANGEIMPPNEATVSGGAAAREWVSQMMGMPDFSVSWKPGTVDVAASGDLGYTAGTYELHMQGPDGSPVDDHGKYLTVWNKDADGKWKVVRDMFNSDVPLPAPSASDDSAKSM